MSRRGNESAGLFYGTTRRENPTKHKCPKTTDLHQTQMKRNKIDQTRMPMIQMRGRTEGQGENKASIKRPHANGRLIGVLASNRHAIDGRILHDG